ncbi:MAG: hypothetical protein ACMG6H_00760, partial [Acidobacteriota bacterium]
LKALKLTILAACLLLMASRTDMAAQQSPTPTPESEEIIRLRQEKTRVELEKDIAVAEKAKLEATVPKSATSPLTGETKVNDGAVIESDMVSYLSMAYAANRVVAQLREAKVGGKTIAISNLAIYNKADIDLLLNYKATTAQLTILRQEFCTILNNEPPQCGGARIATRSLAPLSIVGSFLGAFVDMTALLRSNVTVQGHTFDINEAALVAEVFRAARSEGGFPSDTNLYYPATFPPTDPTLKNSQLLLILEDLHDLKARALVEIHNLEAKQKDIAKLTAAIAKLTALIEEGPDEIKAREFELETLLKIKKDYEAKHKPMPVKKLERIAQLEKMIPKIKEDLASAPARKGKAESRLKQLLNGKTEDEIKDLISRMNLVNDRFDQLVATLIKVDASTGINSLTAYIRAENLTAVLKDPNSYWLQLAVLKAGGNNRIKTNLLIDIFTGGSRLSHSGGVIVQYNLYSLTGKSIASDTLTEYSGYIKAGKIKRLPNP